MSVLPWFFAVDHLPDGAAGVSRALMEGDGALSTSGSTSGVYASSTIGRNIVRVAHATNTWAQKNIPGVSELTVGMRIDLAGTTGSAALISLQNSAGGVLLALFYNTGTGRLEVRRGSTVLATSTDTLSTGAAYYIEFYALIHGSAGAFEVRVNGAEEASGSGVNTANTSGDCEQVVFRSHATGTANHNAGVTDLYIREASGPQFYGPIVLLPLRPDADIQAEWTPDTGSDNFSRVDETTTDEDTSYIESDSIGDRDIYGLGNLPGGANSIIAVVGVTVAQSPEGGAPLVATGISDGANHVVGDGRTIGPQGQYQTQATVFLTAPDGGAWSPAKADAVRLIVEAA